MTIKDPDIIKGIIRSNFDRSVLPYNDFEEKYNLFNHLSVQLAEACGIKKGMTVCDIGCGTGTSSMVLSDFVGEEGRVIGVDFSEDMLGFARERMKDLSNIEFTLSDAECFCECLDRKVDAVLYNACIFLIPDSGKTLECAFESLKDGGVVGMNYLIGMFGDDSTTNLFRSAANVEFAPYGRSIVDINTMPHTLKEAGFGTIRKGTTSKPMTYEEVENFYSIPAQSAGLYPKTPYEERRALLGALLDHIKRSGHAELNQVWGWISGLK